MSPSSSARSAVPIDAAPIDAVPIEPIPIGAAPDDAAPVDPAASLPSGAPAVADAPVRRRTAFNWQDWRLKFVALGLIWGLSFLFIKVGTQAFAPLQVTLGRMAFGAVVLIGAAAFKREGLPRDLRTWGHLTIAAVLLNALPFSLFAYSELYIPSTLAGICNATTPLFSLLVALVALRDERPTGRRTFGMALGFAGVLVVLGAWQGFAGVDMGGTAMALIASASYAIGWAYVRRFLSGTGRSSLSLSSAQLLIGTAQLAVLTPLFTSAPTSFPLDATLSVFALGALGTGLAFLLQYGLVRDAGATVGTMVTYLIPIVATVAGVVLLDERLTWNLPVGAVIILSGAFLAQNRKV
ncbi:DMT family transporter [Wenjunlia tyrosinilytica]|uniref:Transporter n=1 Tax=Wenjunlia tyrosinilytica TaxID=1544741 RepID=A0A917ZLX0_9ACTN|nr:DMT family transporter [Wenjunlia tyrosinilytica]GGO84462.1 transporter [Wenjunlia tyrosinilytica]